MYFWLQSQWDNILNILGHDEFNVKVLGTFVVTTVMYWLIGGFFTFLDLTGRPKGLLKYKIQETAKPYPITKAQLKDLVVVVFRNQLLTIPVGMVHLLVDKWRGLPMQHELPGLFEAFLHLLGFVVIIEIAFYYSHRMFHHPLLYKHIHKKHHTWIAPIAVAAAYCHPIEHIVANVTPLILGPIILNSHIAVMWLWATLGIANTLTHHSGYHFPYLPSPEFHDFHHLKFNYNYGVLGILDYLHGTDELFRKSKQSKRHRHMWTTTPVKLLFP